MTDSTWYLTVWMSVNLLWSVALFWMAWRDGRGHAG